MPTTNTEAAHHAGGAGIATSQDIYTVEYLKSLINSMLIQLTRNISDASKSIKKNATTLEMASEAEKIQNLTNKIISWPLDKNNLKICCLALTALSFAIKCEGDSLVAKHYKKFVMKRYKTLKDIVSNLLCLLNKVNRDEPVLIVSDQNFDSINRILTSIATTRSKETVNDGEQELKVLLELQSPTQDHAPPKIRKSSRNKKRKTRSAAPSKKVVNDTSKAQATATKPATMLFSYDPKKQDVHYILNQGESRLVSLSYENKERLSVYPILTQKSADPLTKSTAKHGNSDIEFNVFPDMQDGTEQSSHIYKDRHSTRYVLDTTTARLIPFFGNDYPKLIQDKNGDFFAETEGEKLQIYLVEAASDITEEAVTKRARKNFP